MFHGCSLSINDSLSLVTKFIAANHLTKDGIEQLLCLLKLHLPSKVDFPSTFYRYEKLINTESGFGTENYYCKQCLVVVDENCVCEKCHQQLSIPDLRKEGSFFIMYDIRSQLMDILHDTEMKIYIEEAMAERNSNDDSHYGHRYKSMTKNTSDLTCTFSIDGVPVFKSSKYSLWPFSFVLDELPYRVRRRNVMIGALWFGDSKMNVDLVFSKLVPYLNSFQDDAVHWFTSAGLPVASRIIFTKCSVDSPARCMIQGLTQYNGEFGCSWCKLPGQVVNKGKGHCRVYPFKRNLESILRNSEEHRRQLMDGSLPQGAKCQSALLELKGFDIFEGAVVEAMHCVYGGVMKTLAINWMKNHKYEYYIGRKKEAINARLKCLKVTTEIPRIPSVIELFKFFKCSEWRTMLFTLPIILDGILLQPYRKHLCRLANAIFMVSKPVVSEADILKCEKELKQVVRSFETLYGEEYMSFNVHQLGHICQTVRNWGPLWQSSAFMFESYYGNILKHVKSSNGVPVQITKRIQLERMSKSSHRGNELLRPLHRLVTKNKASRSCGLVISPVKVTDLGEPIQRKVSKYVNAVEWFRGKKCIFNGITLKTFETQRRADCYVLVKPCLMGRVTDIITVTCACTDSKCDCEKIFLVMEKIRLERVKHLSFVYRKVEENRVHKLIVAPLTSKSVEKCMKIEFDGQTYFIHLCNSFEAV